MNLGDVLLFLYQEVCGETMLPQLFKQYDRMTRKFTDILVRPCIVKRPDLIIFEISFFTSLTNDQLLKANLKKKDGDYDELWYKDINEKVVVIARKEEFSYESITLLVVFCSFLFLVSVVQLYHLC